MVSFFNELETRKNMLIDLYLIMDSRRTMLWKEYMSRYKPQSWLQRHLH
jgi:hypothetical protein